MIRRKRFIALTIVVAFISGVVQGAFSSLVSPLPISMLLFTSLNFGLLIACIDAHRKLTRRRNGQADSSGRGFEIGGVVVVTASALVGTQSILGLNAELFLSTALLVMTVGYVAFFLGMFAYAAKRS